MFIFVAFEKTVGNKKSLCVYKMNKTAIILFADLPEFEARAKSFSGFSSQKVTRKISSVLTQHFYQLAKQTTATTFLVDTFHQNGNGFGERIANAFADIYAKGFENVICIGNDCPALSLSQLQDAISQTEKGKVVLGPSQDGGAYLIGIPKNKFDKNGFSAIKWQTKQAFRNLIGLFKALNSSVFKSPVLKDIDSEKDLYSYFKENLLVKVLLDIINKLKPKNTLYLHISFLRLTLSQTFPPRGPPTVSHSF